MLTISTSSDFAAEKEYCFHVLFREMLGAEYRMVWNEEKEYHIRLANGNTLLVENHFFEASKNGNYLKANHLPVQVATASYEGVDFVSLFGETTIQQENNKEHAGIRCQSDLFAGAFFMLTRWEEYVWPECDEHGRFPAAASTAVQSGFLERPVVNEWADLLWKMLQQLGYEAPRPEKKFRLSISCDVDHPRLWWSPADRLKTLAGSLLKRGNVRETLFWIQNHLFKSRDPYDVFDEWLELFEGLGIQADFNFLGARAATSDCYYPIAHPFVEKTIQKIAAKGHTIGFHPSYEAFDEAALFQPELDSVQALSPTPVRSGRQHYLRFEVPSSWQIWSSAGMAWDSTMGYSEAEGFRCGICHDFPVFDILNRKMLPLREKPLIAMDVTLALYRQYSPQEALQRLLQLRRQVEKHRGEFVFLWHNSSWNTYFWATWKDVFLRFIAT